MLWYAAVIGGFIQKYTELIKSLENKINKDYVSYGIKWTQKKKSLI